MRLSVIYLASLACLAGCADQAPQPACAKLMVAPAMFGQNPVVQDRIGSSCRIEPAPEGMIGSSCIDTEASCLTETFGFPGGACVTIDQCSVPSQTGCPDNGRCFAVAGHAWCFQRCADDLDCRYADGYRCQGGGCFPRCHADDDCQSISAGQLVCDVGTGRCAIDRGCPAHPCAADEECVQAGTGSGAQCLRRCDMLAQDCGPKQACVYTPTGLAVCSDTGFAAVGAGCTAFNECERGSQCAGGTCKPICDKTTSCTCGADMVAPH